MSKSTLPSHILHSGFFHPVLRSWQAPNVELTPNNLMFPLFIGEEQGVVPLPSMPGVFRYGCSNLKDALQPLVDKGLKSILLFGVLSHLPKDEKASHADSVKNPVMMALPRLRNWFPNLVIACDVCLCSYTSHGHCGLMKDGVLDNEASIARIAEVAVSYANAGAHIIAPSDMMDGRVGAIKEYLIKAGFGNRVAVLSYSAKFASGFYGPFRSVTKSAPVFSDRKCYQLPPGSQGLAARACSRDVEEGCDMLMVKPGLPYLDIVKKTKENHPEYPLFVFQVSGEYAMLYHAAKAGALDLKQALEEVLLAMRRAGADCIITYFTPLILDWLAPKSKY
ncbi:delta-aminolevulinic acid dehydratase [Schistocerca americana]|uniref:delta-aminolevulinic acid dehydratase n=1 Tax=Schistocerca americana TaxID=7009 RepID=UPI001F4FF0A9|nr:delta-aminolevulinic acid dehydratase [Schistocerca americana]